MDEYPSSLSHHIIDKYMGYIPTAPFLTLLFIARSLEHGGYKEEDRISITQFEGGRSNGNGSYIWGTGLSKRTITSALQYLETKGIITSRGRHREIRFYRLTDKARGKS